MKKLYLAFLILAGLLAVPQPAWAHETITVGEYAVEYGWANEPAVAGQANAVVINLRLKDAGVGDQQAEIDVSGLRVQAVYGGQSKGLALQPRGEDTPGQFLAPLTPTRPGTYTIHLGGKIGATTFDTDVQPEEVHPADLVEFPALDQGGSQIAAPAGLAGWVGVAGLIFGVLGTILGLAALRRRPAKH